jgi:uncharacterized repeat protein (TIGR01451 family)
VGLAQSADVVNPGDFLRYTITVTNRGPLQASGVVLTDRLPAGASLVFSPSGADCGVTNGLITCNLGAVAPGTDLTVRLTVAIVDGPPLTNTVTAIASTGDPDPTNNSDTVVAFLAGSEPPPAPVLTGTQVGSSLTLSWPSNAVGFILESTSALGSNALWNPVLAQPTVASGTATVNITSPGKTSFYRLRKP